MPESKDKQRPNDASTGDAAGMLRKYALAGYTDAVRARIALYRGKPGSNCIGAALYLTGALDHDEPIKGPWVHEYAKLKSIEVPVECCIISWEAEFSDQTIVNHMGIVVSIEPLLITHVPCAGSQLREDVPFPELHRLFLMPGYECKFYLPMLFDNEFPE